MAHAELYDAMLSYDDDFDTLTTKRETQSDKSIVKVNMNYIQEQFDIAKKYIKSEEEKIAYLRALTFVKNAIVNDNDLLDLQDLRMIFTDLEKESFSVDLGHTETMAVKLVDVEDMLINQFKK